MSTCAKICLNISNLNVLFCHSQGKGDLRDIFLDSG